MTGTAFKRLLLFPVLLFVVAAPLLAKEVKKMNLSSPAFVHSKEIPPDYTCDGNDVSPPLAISGVPKEAKSLVLIMDDPDAPAGDWVHWVLYNIDPATKEIAKGGTPAGALQGLNSWHRTGYGGPCPPSGTHRYYFRLYALSQRLELSAKADRSAVERAVQGKVIESCELLGTYRRK